jgi:hypothetical protein
VEITYVAEIKSLALVARALLVSQIRLEAFNANQFVGSGTRKIAVQNETILLAQQYQCKSQDCVELQS